MTVNIINCSICVDFQMIASNINAKISNNNNTNPKLSINEFMILNFCVLEYFSLKVWGVKALFNTNYQKKY